MSRIEEILRKKVQISYQVMNGTEQQRAIIDSAIVELRWLLNESTWRKDVLYRSQYEQTNLTNERLLINFIEANERGKSEVDYELDIELKFYFKR